jgi:two-component system nitrate/nitrite response regulator NarL
MSILVADDHALVRDIISTFLASQTGANLERANDFSEALERVGSSGPFDLVLLDYEMPGMNGLDGLRSMIRANHGKPVAILSGSASRGIAEAALALGAAGFIPKTMSAKSMVFAVKFMISGEKFAPFEYLFKGNSEDTFGLSSREKEVLVGICAGKSNKEIARDLDLQEVTIKMHVRSLAGKMGAKNRTHAAMMAREKGLV